MSIDYKNKKIDFLEVKKYEDGSMEKIPLKYNEFQSNFSFEQEIENKMDRVPVIANQQNALSNIKKINQMYGAWRQGDDFNSLPKDEKDKISNSEFLQKAYDYAYRGNVPGLSALLKKNQDKSINLTSVNSLALKMSINNGNQDIMRVLIANGADPRGINLDMVNSPALKDYLKQEIYKREHPVLSTIGIKGK